MASSLFDEEIAHREAQAGEQFVLLYHVASSQPAHAAIGGEGVNFARLRIDDPDRAAASGQILRHLLLNVLGAIRG